MSDTYRFTPERVKSIRFRLGLYQKDFAELLGVTVGTVAAWETGHQSPKRGPLLKRLIDAERQVERDEAEVVPVG